MGLYEVPLFMYLYGFGMVTMLANFHMCGIMLLLRAVLKLNILVRNASPRVSMYFRYLIFSLSGPCELLFLVYCIASWACVNFTLLGSQTFLRFDR